MRKIIDRIRILILLGIVGVFLLLPSCGGGGSGGPLPGGDNVSPVVLIVSPLNGATVNGTVIVALNTTDNSGTIASIVIYVDNVQVFSQNGNLTQWQWNTPALTNANHILKVSAYDPTGNRGDATVTVFVLNTGGAIQILNRRLPTALTGLPYGIEMAASGGTGPYSWAVIDRALPPGMGLSTAGELTGTPTASGNYTFAIQVTDSSGPPKTGTQNYDLLVSAVPACPSPSNVQASDGTFNGKVTIAWTGPGCATGYRVYRTTTVSGTYQIVGDGNPVAALSFDDVNVPTGGVDYYYRVTSDNGSVESPLSASADAGWRKPDAPGNVAASDGTVGGVARGYVEVTYDAVAGATGYRLYRSDFATGPFSWLGDFGGTTADDAEVVPGSTYYYEVSTVVGSREGDLSAADSGSANRSICLQNFAATDGTLTNGVESSWVTANDPQCANATFKLSRVTWPRTVGYTLLGQVAASPYFDTTPVAGQVYAYLAWAYVGNTPVGSAWDTGFESAGMACTLTLTAPDGGETWAVGTVQAASWTSVGTCAPRVILDYTKDVGQNYALISGSASNTGAYSWTVPDDPSSTVRWRIRESGGSAAQDTSNADFTLQPAAPTAPGASDGTYSDKIRVTWSTAGSAIDQYEVWRSGPSAAPPVSNAYALVGTTSLTTYDDVDGTLQSGNGNLYWYKVRGVRNGVPSAFAGPDSGWKLVPSPDTISASDGLFTDKVQVTWNAVGGVDGYNLYRSDTQNGAYTKLNPALITATSYDDTTALKGLDYWYKLKAVTGGVEGAFSPPDPGWRKPTAPAGVAASDGASTANVTVTWTAGTDAYEVFRSTSSGGLYSLIASGLAGASYGDTSAAPGVDYWYRVRAVDGGHESDDSAADSGWRKPTAPTGLAASKGTVAGKVQLGWNAVGGASGFTVDRASGPGGPYASIGLSVTTGFADTTAAPGTDFWYVVHTNQGTHESDDSSSDSGWWKPPAPTGVSATDGTLTNEVQVTWNAVAGAASYNVYRATSAGGPYNLQGSSVTTTYDDLSALTGTDYWYEVSAAGPQHEGDLSAADAGWRAPVTPANLAASDGTLLDRVRVTWDTVTGANSYSLYRATAAGGPYTLLASGLVAATYDDMTAASGVNYYYVARTVVGSHESGNSNEDAGYRGLAPPTGVAATDGTFTDKIQVTWNAFAGADGYDVYRSTASGGPYTKINGALVTGLSYDDLTAAVGTDYWYEVKTLIGANQSGFSANDSGWRGPVAPTGVAASDGTFTDKVQVTWTLVAGASSIKVFRADASGGPYAQVGTAAGAATSFDDTTAVVGKNHWYLLHTVIGTHESADSANDAGWRMPGTPTGVAASDGTFTDKVQITWTAVTGASSYTVYRATASGGPYSSIGTSAAPGFDDTSAAVGTDYWYKVSASGPDHEGAQSTSDSGWRAPTAPTGVAASDGTFFDKVQVTWNTVAGADSYKVARAPAAGGPYTDVAAGVAGTSYDDTSAASGTTYWYEIRTTVGAHDSAYSSADSGYRGIQAPTGVSASDGTFTDKVQITWNAVTGADGYDVYRSTASGGPYSKINASLVAGTSYDDTTAAVSVDYWYELKTIEGSNQSGFSNSDSGWRAPVAPTGVAASDGTFTDKVQVTWTLVASASNIKVFRADASGGPYAQVGTAAGAATSFDDTTAVVGKNHWYLLHTVVGAHESGDSANDQGWRMAATPTGVAASDGTFTDKVQITWTAVTGAASYTVYRSTASGGPYSSIGTSAASPFNDTSAVAGTDYWYKVSASGPDHEGAQSASDSGWRAPTTPTGVAASDGTFTDKVQVTWTATSPADSYKVLRADASGGPYTMIASGVVTTSYDDMTAVVGRNHWYRLRTVVGSHESTDSANDQGWRKPATPTGVTATDGTRTTDVQIAWTIVTGAATYNIHRATSSGGPYSVIANPAASPYNDASAVVGTDYWYKVSASGPDHEGDQSAADTGWRAPDAPTGIAASDGTFTDKVQVTWTAASPADSYKVLRADASGGPYTMIASGVVTTSYDDMTAVVGKNHWYRLRTVVGAHESADSANDQGWRKPTTPTGVSASDGTFTDKVQITWSAVTGATLYTVYRATVIGGPYSSVGTSATTTFDDTTAAIGTDYYYKVSASGPDREGDPSAADAGWRSPVAPTGIAASDGTFTDKVQVTWTAVGGADSYKVLRADASGGPYSQIASGVVATSYDDTTAVVGKNHWYRLRTVIGAHESADSANDQGWRKPGTPTGVSASDGTFTDKVQITWGAVTGATSYTIYRATSSGGVYASVGTSAVTSFDDTTVNAGQDYWYKVSASGLDHEGAQSASDSGWRAPTAPTGVAASDGTLTDKVQITWTAVTGAASYTVYRSTASGGPYSSIGTSAVASFDDTSAAVGTDYWYKVSASGPDHEGAQSASDSGWRAPVAPTGVAASDGTFTDKVQVTWTLVAGADSIKVFRADASGGPYSLIGTAAGAATSFDDTTAVVGKNHWYLLHTVVGAHESGDSANDPGWRKPGTPTGVSASDGSFTDKVQVTWGAVTGATLYTVYRSTASGGPYSSIGTSTASPFNDTSAVAGTDYWYKVSASGPDREGDPSANDAGWRMPGTPTGMAASDGTFTDKVQITWTAVTGAASYTVYRSTASGGPYSSIGTSAGTSYDDASAAVGTDYWYKVSASGPDHEGDPSTSDAGWRAPAPPANLQASKGTFTDRVRVTWNLVSGATNIKVYRANTSGGPYNLIATLAGSAVQYDDTTVAVGVTYWYKASTVQGTGSHEGPMSAADNGYAQSETNPLNTTSTWPKFKSKRDHSGTTTANGPTGSPPAPVTYATDSPIKGSPTIDGSGRVYIGGLDFYLYSLTPTATTFTLNWRFFTGNYVTSAPAIDTSNILYFGGQNGMLYALNQNGTTKWSYATGGAIEGSPTLAGNKAIAGSNDGKVYALNMADGTLAWTANLGGQVRGSPAYGNSQVYVGSTNGTLAAINLGDGSVAWSINLGTPLYSSPALSPSGTVLYIGGDDGTLYARNTNNGSSAGSYSPVPPDNASITSSPSVDSGGNVYFGNWAGKVYKLNSGLGLVWTFGTGDIVESSPSLDASGNVYFGSWDRYIYGVNSAGSQMWRKLTGDILTFSSPAIGPLSGINRIYIGSYDLKIWAVKQS